MVYCEKSLKRGGNTKHYYVCVIALLDIYENMYQGTVRRTCKAVR